MHALGALIDVLTQPPSPAPADALERLERILDALPFNRPTFEPPPWLINALDWLAWVIERILQPVGAVPPQITNVVAWIMVLIGVVLLLAVIIYLVLNVRRGSVAGLTRLDYAINATLLLSYVVTLKGDHAGLLTFADNVRTYLAPKRGKSQFYRMLETLYNVPFEPVESDDARALTYLSVRHKRRSLIVVFIDLVTLDAARDLIAHMARLARRHLPLCVVLSDPNITRLVGCAPAEAIDVYRRAVAEMLLAERRVVLETPRRNGVLILNVPADRLSVAVIEKYLELKGRGML